MPSLNGCPSIVGHRQRATKGLHRDGLGVVGTGAARGAVSYMTHGTAARESAHARGIEYLRHQAAATVTLKRLSRAGGDNARRLLPSMLKRMQAQVG